MQCNFQGCSFKRLADMIIVLCTAPVFLGYLLSLSYPADFLLNRLLYRDGLILVIDKPAGLAVHARPGVRSDTDHLEQYFEPLRFGLPRLPVLAHRLDRDTSGCLVLARHPKAARKMGKLFQEGRIRKTYWAICKGVPEKLSGTVDLPLYKENQKSGWRMRAGEGEGAKAAATKYRVLAQADEGLSLIECRPKTGRTHQIRVHLAALGIPILGDPNYGVLSDADRAQPMMLHARALLIPLSASKPPVEVSAVPPAAMQTCLSKSGLEFDLE